MIRYCTQYNFTIPARTPPAKYLLRWEYAYPVFFGETQFYINCAHIEVVNASDDIGGPGPLVKIPGVYTFGQPGTYALNR